MIAKKLHSLLQSCWRNIFPLSMAVLFFVVYLWGMSFYVKQAQFNSPDENANYYFIDNLSKTGQIPVIQKPGLTDIVHPRSILVWQNTLVPISFPGLIYLLVPFYFMAGLWGIFVFYALLFIFLLYLFWRWLRRENLPMIFWWVVAVQPALWYYLFHPLFNNILSFLLGFCALFLLAESRQWAKNIGVFLMILALWVRPFDIIYFGPILLLASIYYQVPWKKRLKYFLAVGAGSLLLFFLSNYLVYGQIYLFGYNLPKPTSSVAEVSVDYWRHFKLFLKNTCYFLAQLFWPYFSLAVLGLVAYMLAWRRNEKVYHFLFACLLLAGGALVVFYGVGDLNDHVVKNNVSIGGAFARYWLPVYCLLSFLIAYLLNILKKADYRYFSYGMVLVLAMFSGYAVVYRDNDSLMLERYNLLAGIQEKELLQKIIPEELVLVLDREDKYFFPERSVIHLSEFKDDYALKGIKDLIISGKTIYYYGFTLFELDWHYLHEQKLRPLNLQLRALSLGAEKSLYQFELYE
jgi:hypothetical protein